MDLFAKLTDCLLFYHVKELKETAASLQLETKGNKKQLIFRIVYFLKTGKKTILPIFPLVSQAKKGHYYPLEENTLMVKGAYKNDLKNRLFFKKIIGSHFHFTAFGIDWLTDRWLEGNPPTYKEFAAMWQDEHEKRKIIQAKPKDEWAYIRFVQNFLKKNPDTSKETVLFSWKKERSEQKLQAEIILKALSGFS